MEVILKEIRKNLNIKTTLIVLLGAILIYKMFIYYPIEVALKNNRPTRDAYELSIQLQEKYGSYLDSEEFKAFKRVYEEKVKDADKILGDREDCKAVGINNYKDFKNYDGKENETNEVRMKISLGEKNDWTWELEAMEELILRYENLYLEEETVNENKHIKKRALKLIESKEYLSIYDSSIEECYDMFLENLGLLMILTLTFIVSPIFIKDKMTGVNKLQYTSKIGRKIYTSKLVSAIASAAIVGCIEVSILVVVFFLSNKSTVFWNNNINSFLNSKQSFMDITYGQYVIITMIFFMILLITTVLGSIYISNKAKSYIGVIAMQVPFIAILIWNSKILRDINNVYKPYFTIVIYILMCVTSVILIFKQYKNNSCE